jgi:hypothetical protein
MQHCNPFDDDDMEQLDSLVNPANGLPMIGGIAGVDVVGNAFGMDQTFDHGGRFSWD